MLEGCKLRFANTSMPPCALTYVFPGMLRTTKHSGSTQFPAEASSKICLRIQVTEADRQKQAVTKYICDTASGPGVL